MTTAPAATHTRFSLKEVFIASVLGTSAHVGLGALVAPDIVTSSFVATAAFGAAVLASVTEGLRMYLQGDTEAVYDLPTRTGYMYTAGLGAMAATILMK